MSLAAAALRIITVKAIDLATSAGGRVFDTIIDPRALLGEDAAPTVVVYTDRGKRKVIGRDLIGSDHVVMLGIETFVAKSTLVDVEGQDAAYQVEYPATDGGMENRLRRLGYEIESVLGGAIGPWAELWKRIVVRFCDTEHVEWDRGGDAEKGSRFNFIRSQYPVEVISDPVRGAILSPGDFWFDFLAAMDAEDELRDLARDWRALITSADLPAWRRAMSELGLSYPELRAIGLAPMDDHQQNSSAEAATLTELILDPEGLVDHAADPSP